MDFFVNDQNVLYNTFRMSKKSDFTAAKHFLVIVQKIIIIFL